jgi:hypothetical protein
MQTLLTVLVHDYTASVDTVILIHDLLQESEILEFFLVKTVFSQIKGYLNTLGTRTNLSFYGSAVRDQRDKFFLLRHVRFESTIHCSVAPQLMGSSWVTSISCLFMDIRYVTSLLSHLRLNEWHLFV